MKKLLPIIALATLIFSCEQEGQKADLIITNAVIWTADEANPSATSLVIAGDRILYVGNEQMAMDYNGKNTQLKDANGAFMVPGFIDTHVHFLTGGQNLSSVQLRTAATPEEFIQRIADFASTQPTGAWIMGGDWDHQNWGGELPQRSWIDSVTRDNPILLNRLDGHMALTNSLGLELLGLDAEVEPVDGGEFIRSAGGDLTGILTDNAYYDQLIKVPAFTTEKNEAYVKAAMKYVASHGVTSVHDMDGFGAQSVYESLHQKGELTTRIYSNVPLANWARLNDKVESKGRGDEWLKIGGLKGFVDGSLGSHTAAFFEGYSDEPSSNGFFVSTQDELLNDVLQADDKNLQIMIHAIGDSANHTLLNIYEEVQRINGVKDRRSRIEHAQHLSIEDIPRFKELGVIPVMQPYHAIDDGRWAEKYIGDRIKTTYAFRSLLDAGARLAFGSDWFVAPPIPLLGIYAAVTRQTLDGANPDGWVPEQKISVEEALKAYTLTGAYASFEEDLKGSLEEGKLADFVILDQNLLLIDPVTIKDVKVLETYVGGTKVFAVND